MRNKININNRNNFKNKKYLLINMILHKDKIYIKEFQIYLSKNNKNILQNFNI